MIATLQCRVFGEESKKLEPFIKPNVDNEHNEKFQKDKGVEIALDKLRARLLDKIRIDCAALFGITYEKRILEPSMGGAGDIYGKSDHYCLFAFVDIMEICSNSHWNSSFRRVPTR